MQLSSYNELVKDLKLHMLWGSLHVHEPYFDLGPWMGATLDWDFPTDLFPIIICSRLSYVSASRQWRVDARCWLERNQA